MSANSTGVLEKLLRENDLGWIIEWFVPPGKAVPTLLVLLEAATKESRARFGAGGPQFTDAILDNEFRQNPDKVRAFLQALGATRNRGAHPRILVGFAIPIADVLGDLRQCIEAMANH